MPLTLAEEQELAELENLASSGQKSSITASGGLTPDEELELEELNKMSGTQQLKGTSTITGKSLEPERISHEGPTRGAFQDIPIGSMLGAAAMAPFTGGASLPVAAGLTALGAAGGEAYEQIYKQVAGDKSDSLLREAPKTSTEAAKRIGLEGIYGAAGEAVFRGLGWLAGKIAPGVKMTPDIKSRLALEKKTGVKLSIADITQKKHHGLAESFFEKNIPSSNIAQAASERKVAQVNAYKELLQEEAGGTLDTLSAGQISQEGAWQRYRNFMQQAQQKYDAVPVPKDFLVETNSLRDVAVGHIDELGKYGGSLNRILNIAKESVDPEIVYKPSTIIKPSGQPFQGAKMPTYTWQKLMSDRTTLGKMWRSTSDRDKKRVLKDLIDAIDDDVALLSNKVGNENIKNSLDEAIAFYKTGGGDLPGVKVWRDRQIVNAMATNSPEDIVNKFIKPQNVSDVNRLMDAVGYKGRQAIKRAWMEKLFTKGEEQSFSLAKYATGINKYDDATLKSFLTPEEIDGLKTLAKVSRISATSEKIAGNPSGTAQNVGTFLTIWNAIKNPVTASIYWMGSKKAANLYFNNPSYRKLLIEGLKIPPKSQKAMEISMKLMTISGASEIERGLSSTQQGRIEPQSLTHNPETGEQ